MPVYQSFHNKCKSYFLLDKLYQIQILLQLHSAKQLRTFCPKWLLSIEQQPNINFKSTNWITKIIVVIVDAVHLINHDYLYIST